MCVTTKRYGKGKAIKRNQSEVVTAKRNERRKTRRKTRKETRKGESEEARKQA